MRNRYDHVTEELAFWRAQRPSRAVIAAMLLILVVGLLAVWSV